MVYYAKWKGNTEVAVKRLNFVLSQDPDETKKFEDEAALLARLRHPNIILFQGFTIFDDDAWSKELGEVRFIYYIYRFTVIY